MLRSAFSRARLSLGLTTAILLIAAPGAFALPDYDMDGFTDGDCVPTDPAVHPGAADKPDLSFEDMNCDGIDGDAAQAVFVAESGDDGAAGTRESPKRTMSAALEAGRDVYVAGGTYGGVNAVANVGIYGGYAAGSWARSESSVTTIAGSPQAVLADADVGVVLQLLTLRGTADGGSGYGLRAINGSKVAASKVTVSAADAGAGQSGAPGNTGAAGAAGGNGGCPAAGTAGAPGTPNAGGAGGAGATGAVPSMAGTDGSFAGESGALPGEGGEGGANATGTQPAQNGTQGTDGGPGEGGPAGANSPFTRDSAGTAWTGGSAAAGTPGTPGAGGGGGGGGGRGLQETQSGGGGGGGASGGDGGSPGGPGTGGGGSFGAYLHNSTLVATLSGFAGGNGGNGGNGGAGGAGGGGGGRSTGGTCPDAGAGGPGGAGGKGGDGGAGGAGAGGPSAGVFRTGTQSAYSSRSSNETNGVGGSGGIRPSDATQAEPGAAEPIMRAVTAPEGASGDFDADGTLDLMDPCPETPADGGCPDRPDKLPDADGDHIPDSADACPSTPRGHDPNEDGCPDGSEPPPPPPPPPPADNPPPGGPPSAPPPAPRAQPARVGATVSFRSSNRGRNTVFSSLVVRNIPGGATVVVRCRGKSCPVRRFVKRRAVGTLSLRQFVGKRLRPGTVLDIRITKSGFVGLVKDITIRAGRTPSVRTLCLAPGSSRASRC